MAMILAGEVQLDGQRVEKAGMPVAEDARIEIISRRQKFVSRGGTKLDGALEDFAIEPAGCVCPDIGSSNGGFTDFLPRPCRQRGSGVGLKVGQPSPAWQPNPPFFRDEPSARARNAKTLRQSC